MDRSSVAFEADRHGSLPPQQVVNLQVTGARAAYVGAGYRSEAAAAAASWLSVNVSGSAPAYSVQLQPNTLAMSPGTYTATLAVGTADVDGNILKTRDIRVQYVVTERLKAEVPPGPQALLTYGHTRTREVVEVPVHGNGKNWRAASDRPWLQVAGDSFSGSRALSVTVEAASLGVGTHTGHITVTNQANPSETSTVELSVAMLMPDLIASAGTILLGGSDGRDLVSGSPLTFSLDTGGNSYPWTLRTSTADGRAWLTSDATSGTISAAGTELLVKARRELVTGGIYTGTLTVEADVRGVKVSRQFPVRLNREAERLFVDYDGIALTKLPSRQLLSRTIKVSSTLGNADVPWTATANVPWLEVTGSGTTGGTLRVQANPAGLAANRSYVGTVTVKSEGTGIENTQTIQVGLWIGGADLEPRILLDNVDMYSQNEPFAVSPVEPLFFWHDTSGKVIAYNLFTGVKVREFSTGLPTGREATGPIAISSDGRLLAVADPFSARVRVLSASDGSLHSTYGYSRDAYDGYRSLSFGRPAAVPMLFTGTGVAIDLETKQRLPEGFGSYYDTGKVVATLDGREVYVNNWGVAPSSMRRFSTSWSWLHGRQFGINAAGGIYSSGAYYDDLAVSADGTRVFTQFAVFNAATGQRLYNSPADTGLDVETDWAGRYVWAGARTFLFGPDDELIATLPLTTYDHTLRFSGDGLQFITVHYNGSVFSVRSYPIP